MCVVVCDVYGGVCGGVWWWCVVVGCGDVCGVGVVWGVSGLVVHVRQPVCNEWLKYSDLRFIA